MVKSAVLSDTTKRSSRAPVGPFVALTLITLIAAYPSLASADLVLRWQAPSSCPSGVELRSRVERLLPRPLEESASLVADAVVTDEPAWSVTLTVVTGGRTFERSFEAVSCEELANATALVLALTINPDGAAHALSAPDSAGETEASDADDADSEEAVEAPVDPEPDEGNWALSASVGLDFGVLPAVVPTLELGALYQRQRFVLLASIATALPQEEPVAGSDAAARIGWGVARLSSMFRLRRSALGFDIGGVVEAGVLGGRGSGVSTPRTAYALWAAAGALAAFSAWVGPVSLRIGGDVRFPFNRPTIAVKAVGNVYQPSFGVLRAFFSVEVHFL